MKIAFPFLGLLAVLGIAYALAFFGVIPVQKMASKSPGLDHMLIALHLAKAKKPAAASKTASGPGAISPEQEALNTEKKQLADQKAALTKEQADFEAQKQTATSALPAAQTTAASAPAQNSAGKQDGAAKLDAIYAAMSADDLLTIFAKLPDPDIVRALTNLDEKKAGKILAGLPPARAARLTQKMSHAEPKLQATPKLQASL